MFAPEDLWVSNNCTLQYDEECTEVESYRQKQVGHNNLLLPVNIGSALLGRAGHRTTGTPNVLRSSMSNSRWICKMPRSGHYSAVCSRSMLLNDLFSVYLVATAVANKTKAKFYDADLPSLENVRWDPYLFVIHPYSFIYYPSNSV